MKRACLLFVYKLKTQVVTYILFVIHTSADLQSAENVMGISNNMAKKACESIIKLVYL